MLWTIFAVLLVLWLVGMIGGVGGQYVHLLILAAGALLIFNFISNRRKAF